jgi:hypothetical protein
MELHRVLLVGTTRLDKIFLDGLRSARRSESSGGVAYWYLRTKLPVST